MCYLTCNMLTRSSDDAAMQALLSPYGEIFEISIIKDKATGESKGLHLHLHLTSPQHTLSCLCLLLCLVMLVICCERWCVCGVVTRKHFVGFNTQTLHVTLHVLSSPCNPARAVERIVMWRRLSLVL
jgi:hypothetical protein